MPRDILGEYGSDTPQPQAPVATSGGVTSAKPLPYSPPMGPKGIMGPQSPGLHGSNHGNENGPDMGGSHSGSPGIGGTNHGNRGTQGRH
jgi:hypothetical protein